MDLVAYETHDCKEFLQVAQPFLSNTASYPFSLLRYFCVETFSARRSTDILYRRSMDLNFLWSHSLQERKILHEVAPRPVRRKKMQRQFKRRGRSEGMEKHGKKKRGMGHGELSDRVDKSVGKRFV